MRDENDIVWHRGYPPVMGDCSSFSEEVMVRMPDGKECRDTYDYVEEEWFDSGLKMNEIDCWRYF